MSLQVNCQSVPVVQFSLHCSVQHRLVERITYGYQNTGEFNTECILLILPRKSLLGKNISSVVNRKSSSVEKDMYILSVEGCTLICRCSETSVSYEGLRET